MINNKLFVGNNLTGNFKPKTEITGNIHDYHIEKTDDILYLIYGKDSIELIPVEDKDKFVAKYFSNEPIETNESIYRLEMYENTVILILYTYVSTIRLLTDSQKMRIHLLREAEKQICNEGYSGLQVASKEDIIPLLRELFINNKSIFVHINKKKPNSFQMFSEKYRAIIEMEKPGVYVIERFYKTYNKEYSFELTQIYGDIDFLLWDDAIGFKGNDISLQNIKTNEIFNAWEEYMDFEERIYENDLKDFGIIKYKNIEVDGDKLIFNLNKNDEKFYNAEFEYMSAFSTGGFKKLPETPEKVLEEKDDRKNDIVFIGKPVNEVFDGDKLYFDLPKYNFHDEHKNAEGIIYVSNHSLQIEQRRRKKVLTRIESRMNESANLIMKLSEENVEDRQKGTSYNPINSNVLKKMFGNKDIQIKETYRDAMFIALNTPDIALIQGPPGTGKTTLIRGLITRINGMDKKYKILVSSEQHEALLNVVDKLSENKLIPPFVSSKRFDSDTDEKDGRNFEKNVKEFQKNFANVCNDILQDIQQRDSKANLITECIYIILDIKDNQYSKNYISTVLDQLKEKIILLGYYDKVVKELSDLHKWINNSCYTENQVDTDFKTRYIIRKIEAQRTTLDAFSDDGARQLKDLQEALKKNDYNELVLSNDINQILQNGNEDEIKKVFDKYIAYVENIKNKFIPRTQNEFNKDEINPEFLINGIYIKIHEATKEKPKDFYEIIETLKYRLNDIDAVADVIKNYTSVIGSTCAQAEKSVDIVNLQNDKYDYVIIDEAARANPLDIMIPMMMGIKVIVIGDHKQLPHYIESNVVEKFKNEKNKYSDFDENLLTKSLFQIIYENLDKAYKDGRIDFKRTIRIDEQHRMHPVIGQFISDEFYDGGIKNGAKTNDNINDYNIFNKKNIVWLDVPIFKGKEEKVNQSLARKAEADRIILLIKDLINKNPDKKLNIGIISFYKEQVNLINQMLEDNFPKPFIDDNISCNTVDSYQGKEFDIVILSGVRCNTKTTLKESLGFIHYSPSRINVALSRAKKMLIVVADADTYKRDEHFQNFINYVKKEGYYE